MRLRSNLCYGEDSVLDDMPPTSSWWQSKNRPPRRNTIATPPPPRPPPPQRPKRRPSQSAKRPPPAKQKKVTKPAKTTTVATERDICTPLKVVLGPPLAPLPRKNLKNPPPRRPSVVSQQPAQAPATRNTPPTTNRIPMRRYSVAPGMLSPDRNRNIAAEMPRQTQLDPVRRILPECQSSNFEGYRIVQIDHFLNWATVQQFLHRQGCPEGVYRPTGEYLRGMHSVFEMKCKECGRTVRCASEKYNPTNALNIRMVKAMLQWPSLGYREMRGMMEALEIPFITEEQYNELKSEILSYETVDTNLKKEDDDWNSLVAQYSSAESLQSTLKEASVAIERSLSAMVVSQEFVDC